MKFIRINQSVWINLDHVISVELREPIGASVSAPLVAHVVMSDGAIHMVEKRAGETPEATARRVLGFDAFHP